MQVVPFLNKRYRVVKREHPLPDLTASIGQTLWAIQEGDRFFSWIYFTRVAAEEIEEKLRLTYDGNPSNWKTNTNMCVLSGRY